jgi:hypothetical protein
MTKRQLQFRRNEQLENLLQELNTLLEPVENTVIENFKSPKYPLILLVGCARSGTTLLMQWLATTGLFAYPTNFLSRFYAAPYVGAKIQQMLADPQYNFRDELSDFGGELSFRSNLGKTSGVLAPNEFFYFWRRFFPYGEIQYLDDHSLKKMETDKFVSEVAAIEAVFDKPLTMKGLLINWNIPFVSGLFSRILFIHVKRNPLYNAQSLLEAREKFFGNRESWYSLKPIEYQYLKRLSPCHQVAGQVYYTNRAIEDGLSQTETSRWLQIRYEDFCTSPEAVFEQVKEKLTLQDYQINSGYQGVSGFSSANSVRLSPADFNEVEAAYEEFSRADGVG